MKNQHSLNLDNFTPISFGRSYLYLQYESISSFLRKNFGEEFQDILLKPIKRQKNIDFYSNDNNQYKSIEDFTSSEKEEILIKYNRIINKLERRCQVFSQSDDEDNVEWSQILVSVFDMDANMIFSNGEEIRFVWGWKFNQKKNYFLPLESYTDNSLPQKDEEQIEIVTDESDIVTPIQDPTPIEIPDEIIEPVIEEDVEGIEDIASLQIEGQNESTPKKNWFILLLDWIERMFRRFWWLFLLLLGILIFLIFFKGCNSTHILARNMTPDEIDQAYYEIMPPSPGVRVEPIDTASFINDEESIAIVLGDVINIALKNRTDNFQYFAIDLKNAFEDDKYKIVYFDEETRRLQLSFPITERQEIKNEIRRKLSNYELLIWDESIFSSGRQMNDPVFSDLNRAWYFSMVNAEEAWDITTGNSDVVIAVIDDGFDLNHEELLGKIVKPYNVVTDNDIINTKNNQKHGTHVAAIAVANCNNNKGICGIAPDCSLMPIQAAGAGGYFTMTDVVDGILYAIKNEADVINLSLGKMFGEELSDLPPDKLHELINSFGIDEAIFWDELFKMAEENNIVIVIAAGNENLLVGLDPMQRSKRAIIVTAIDSREQKAWFSNYFINSKNNGYSISAPGVGIYSAVPGNNYESFDGTSMASPIVAGAIALLKSKKPNLTNKQIKEAIIRTSQPTINRTIPPLIKIDKLLKYNF